MLSFFVSFIANTVWYFQVLANPAIAAGKKCCSCCTKISQLINPAVVIPGSHGAIYPWCPPRVGVGLDILEALESQLWDRLYQGLREKHQSSTHSHQSSEPSSIDDSELITFLSKTKYALSKARAGYWFVMGLLCCENPAKQSCNLRTLKSCCVASIIALVSLTVLTRS